MKKMYLTCIAALLMGSQCWGQTQAESTPSNTDVKGKIDQLKSQLRWSDEKSQHEYKANRVQVTDQVWTLIDSFIARNYAGSIGPDQLKATLDSLLGHKSDGVENTVVFAVDIPSGHFVIAGLEITRGGGAIAENAISFRAYGKVDGRWTLISHVELEPEYDFLVDLNALTLPQGFPGTFGFIAWADEPPRSPPTVIARIYTFDGKEFTTVWTPPSFIEGYFSSFVTLTKDGFDLHTLTPDRANQLLQRYMIVSGEVIEGAKLDQGPPQ